MDRARQRSPVAIAMQSVATILRIKKGITQAVMQQNLLRRTAAFVAIFMQALSKVQAHTMLDAVLAVLLLGPLAIRADPWVETPFGQILGHTKMPSAEGPSCEDI
eukprot:1882587-Amphidinium_carterae.3